MHMRVAGLLLVLASACSHTPAAKTPARHNRLVAIDLFGTTQITRDQLIAACGDDLTRFANAMMAGEPTAPEPLLAKVRALGNFADVSPALVGYYTEHGQDYYLTVDVVDAADATRRMAFAAAPTGTFADPDGLLASWTTYEEKVWSELNAGTMKLQRVSCPAYHCWGDHEHPAVREIAARMFAAAPAHVDELVAILTSDRDGTHRGAAAYLIAMAPDGTRVVEAMLSRLRDPEELVRNNTLRVLAEIARFHPDVAIPVEPLLDALDYPTTLDRNKASATLDALLERGMSPELRDRVLKRSSSVLLAMLRLQQPNNHDFAYSILKRLAGKDFGERNYEAWEAWVAQHATSPH
jgi:hypothetical protein